MDEQPHFLHLWNRLASRGVIKVCFVYFSCLFFFYEVCKSWYFLIFVFLGFPINHVSIDQWTSHQNDISWGMEYYDNFGQSDHSKSSSSKVFCNNCQLNSYLQMKVYFLWELFFLNFLKIGSSMFLVILFLRIVCVWCSFLWVSLLNTNKEVNFLSCISALPLISLFCEIGF